ncbi:16971_t:CDS:2, partial [Racocetra fulgida]
MTFSRATSLLDESCDALVNAILKLDWAGVDKNGIVPSNLENIHGKVHYALKNIFSIVPSAAEELLGILSRGFPHKSESLPAQTEVQGKIDEIEDMEDASTKYELSLHSDQGSQSSFTSSIHGKSRFNSPTNSYNGDFDYGSDEDIEDSAPSIVALDIGEMIEKLDCMIKLVFDYLKWFFDKGSKDERDELFDILLTIFEENIFDKEPDIIREATSQYIGSFVGRANYLSSTEIRLCIQALLLWTERYIE